MGIVYTNNSRYQTRVDDALETESKEIVPAINEVLEDAKEGGVGSYDLRVVDGFDVNSNVCSNTMLLRAFPGAKALITRSTSFIPTTPVGFADNLNIVDSSKSGKYYDTFTSRLFMRDEFLNDIISLMVNAKTLYIEFYENDVITRTENVANSLITQYAFQNLETACKLVLEAGAGNFRGLWILQQHNFNKNSIVRYLDGAWTKIGKYVAGNETRIVNGNANISLTITDDILPQLEAPKHILHDIYATYGISREKFYQHINDGSLNLFEAVSNFRPTSILKNILFRKSKLKRYQSRSGGLYRKNIASSSYISLFRPTYTEQNIRSSYLYYGVSKIRSNNRKRNLEGSNESDNKLIYVISPRITSKKYRGRLHVLYLLEVYLPKNEIDISDTNYSAVRISYLGVDIKKGRSFYWRHA